MLRPTLAVMAFASLMLGCSAVDEHPLGGPFGGSGMPPGSSSGSAAGANASIASDPEQDSDAVDAGTSSSDDAGSPLGATWSSIWTKYLNTGTIGDCGRCHRQMGSASAAYTWLKNRGYISSPHPALTDPKWSCLSWYGGDMPPRGPTVAASAKSDMNAWVAAGVPNN